MMTSQERQQKLHTDLDDAALSETAEVGLIVRVNQCHKVLFCRGAYVIGRVSLCTCVASSFSERKKD